MGLHNARYIKSLDGSQPSVTNIVTNADVVAGDILAITSGLVGPLSAAGAAIIGIAQAATASGSECPVLLLNDKSVIRVPFTNAGTKKTFAAADRFGTAFDWNATNKNIDPDDVTGGTLLIVDYDNTNLTADVVIKASALWNV